jgi:hypothetical protein
MLPAVVLPAAVGVPEDADHARMLRVRIGGGYSRSSGSVVRAAPLVASRGNVGETAPSSRTLEIEDRDLRARKKTLACQGQILRDRKNYSQGVDARSGDAKASLSSQGIEVS